MRVPDAALEDGGGALDRPMAAQRPVASTKRQAASTFGAPSIRRAKLMRRSAAGVVRPIGRRRASASRPPERRSEAAGSAPSACASSEAGKILVDHGLDARGCHIRGHDDRNSAAARANDDDARMRRGAGSIDFADPSGLRRGDSAPPSGPVAHHRQSNFSFEAPRPLHRRKADRSACRPREGRIGGIDLDLRQQGRDLSVRQRIRESRLIR